MLTRMARMLTHMLTRMTRWLAGSHIIHTPSDSQEIPCKQSLNFMTSLTHFKMEHFTQKR